MGALQALCVLMLLCACSARSICPAGCSCYDALLSASCADAALEVVPIQLNPEAAHINLTHNKIYNVHFTFGFYTKLVVLDISYNRIDSLGAKNFDSNADLVHLNVSNNKIEKLDKYTFAGLINLVELNLSNNKISEIHPTSFADLKHLEKLDLSDNEIVQFEPATLKDLSNLKVLLLQKNQILELPSDNLIYTILLEHLSLSSNLIANIPNSGIPNLRKLRRLDIDYNIISDIDHSAFDGLSALRHLDLSANNLTDVPTVSLSKLSNLTHLYLSANFFEFISAVSFQSLFNLRHLHISKLGKLLKLDARAFVDNINLEKVWMNDNPLVRNVPSRIFHGNPRLTHISIRNNALITLDASHFPIDRLQLLQVAGNPFNCNCSLLWLWKLAQESKTFAKNPTNESDYSTALEMDYEEIWCSGPEKLRSAALVDVSESEMRCAARWWVLSVALLTGSVLVSVAGALLYYIGPAKKCKGDTSKQVMGGVMLNGEVPKASLVYEGRQRVPDNMNEVDRYLVLRPTANGGFQPAPWPGEASAYLPSRAPEDEAYHQFGYETIPHQRTPDKPHIVYV